MFSNSEKTKGVKSVLRLWGWGGRQRPYGPPWRQSSLIYSKAHVDVKLPVPPRHLSLNGREREVFDQSRNSLRRGGTLALTLSPQWALGEQFEQEGKSGEARAAGLKEMSNGASSVPVSSWPQGCRVLPSRCVLRKMQNGQATPY